MASFKFGSGGSGTGQFAYPTGITIDSYDRVYVSDSKNNCIQIFCSDLTFISSLDGNVSGRAHFQNPYGVAVAPDGNLFIAELDSNNVTVLTGEGQFVRSFVITYSNRGTISIFDHNGRLVHKIEGFDNPHDVKLSLDDSVLISEYGGSKMYKYMY